MNKTKKLISVFTLIITVCVCVCFMTGASSASTDEKPRTSSITLYDGSTNSKQMATVTQNEVVMILKGFSNSPKSLTGVTVNDKSYSYATPTGGKSSTSRSIQLIVPDIYKSFSVYMVATTNTNSAVNIGIGQSAEYTDTDKKVLITGTEPDEYTSGMTESLQPGTYYITFDNSIRIAELTVNVETVAVSDSQSETSGDEDLIIGNRVTPMTKSKKIKIIIGGVMGVAIFVVLVILLCNVIKKGRCKRKHFDGYDLDDYDDYDEFYDEF